MNTSNKGQLILWEIGPNKGNTETVWTKKFPSDLFSSLKTEQQSKFGQFSLFFEGFDVRHYFQVRFLCHSQKVSHARKFSALNTCTIVIFAEFLLPSGISAIFFGFFLSSSAFLKLSAVQPEITLLKSVEFILTYYFTHNAWFLPNSSVQRLRSVCPASSNFLEYHSLLWLFAGDLCERSKVNESVSVEIKRYQTAFISYQANYSNNVKYV